VNASIFASTENARADKIVTIPLQQFSSSVSSIRQGRNRRANAHSRRGHLARERNGLHRAARRQDARATTD